jgi:hypothetical protein
MSYSLTARLREAWKAFNTEPIINKGTFSLKYAFTCGGVDYYEFADYNNLPYQRGLEALTFFQELQNGVDRKYLLEHVDAVDKVLSDPKKINVGQITVLNYRLKDRLNYIISKNVIFNCASVVFVTKDEDPLHYDHAFNARKIEAWKKDADASFFLSEPLQRLIPFLKESGASSLTYLKVVEQIERLHRQAAELKTLSAELNNEND